MEDSRPTSSPTTDFSGAILHLLGANVVRKHHGRVPEEGLDCIGLVMSVYRLVGLPIDELDLPYSVNDAKRPYRFRAIFEQALLRFRSVTNEVWQDGDVLLIRSDGHLGNHLGVLVDGLVWHMNEMSLDSIAIYLVRGQIAAAFRHEEVK